MSCPASCGRERAYPIWRAYVVQHGPALGVSDLCLSTKCRAASCSTPRVTCGGGENASAGRCTARGWRGNGAWWVVVASATSSALPTPATAPHCRLAIHRHCQTAPTAPPQSPVLLPAPIYHCPPTTARLHPLLQPLLWLACATLRPASPRTQPEARPYTHLPHERLLSQVPKVWG